MQIPAGTSEPSGPDGATTLWIRVGNLRPVPVRYVEASGRFYVIPTGDAPEWAGRALQEGACTIRRPGEIDRACGVSYVTDRSAAEVLRARFRRTIGEGTWTRYFEGEPKILELVPSENGVPRLPPDRIAAEFDSSARTYDAAIARHAVDRYLKGRVGQLLSTSLRGVDPLLEIGPGTGYHTLPLLAEGHHILAIDVSSEMLSLLQDRVTRVGGVGHLTVKKGRLGEIRSLCSDIPDGAYAAAYSAFGAFNLEPDLDSVGPTLARIVRPGGRLLFTTLNRPGLVPFAWELLLRRPSSAAARLHERVPAGKLRYPLELALRTPASWDRLLGPGFHRVRTRAVSALAPPFDSPRVDRVLGTDGARRMAGLDEILSRWGPDWRLAEWVWLEYERVDREAGPSKV